MARKLSTKVRNMWRREHRLEEPDIPKSLLARDLSGFRLEYWYVLVDYDGSRTYFRNRRFALREQTIREPSQGSDCIVVARVRVLTSNGHRGWLLDIARPLSLPLTKQSDAPVRGCVRVSQTRAAEREARVARRVRAARAAAPVVPAAA
ncbi:MAG: hypothetical protein Q7R80_04250 [bacterium]|nr:hypothetical protein [bacterium]